MPGEQIVVRSPDVLIVEGLNVLQPPERRAGRSSVTVADFFDFSIYVDAAVADLRRWYVDRFMQLRATAFRNPDDYFHRYAHVDDVEARRIAHDIWHRINEPNLVENIAPTRERANLVLTKGADHALESVALRRI